MSLNKKQFYLTTTLPYVNADPHIGYALECVQADIQARFQRLMGNDVFFSTGTDEHGQKIFQRAQEVGQEVEEYVDYFASRFSKLKSGLNLSYDAFIRTTDPKHLVAAQELWRRCESNVGPDGPDIYKKKYKGLYCVGDEMFLKETDLVSGKCPNHPTMDPIEIEEENYFFRLSRYKNKILEYLAGEEVILPNWRRDEAIKFAEGLEDFSISREKARMSWGIAVPGDDNQVMYVWFDALTNYISTLGWPADVEGTFNTFWVKGETVQMAGKDQVRFQSIMWQGMLMSGGLPTTQKIVYHGFITSGGHKMSKSIGNVIDPFALIDEYGTDALRYYLARHISSFDDSDFTMEKFKQAYNADLANGLGNLVSRVMQLAQTHLQEPVIKDTTVLIENNALINAINGFDTQLYTSLIWEEISKLDESIQLTEPFKVIKVDKEKGQNLIRDLAQKVFLIAKMLEPVIPETSQKIIESILANKKPDNLFPRKD
jgi:methionyl-tRNA synthetase